MKKELLAIYGGTFSPPHLGHIRAAEAFLEAMSPDKLMILPSATPPHKSPVLGAKAKDRVAMCRLAFGHLPRTEVSELEIRREGKSYTVLTLRELSSPERDLVMLVGTDMLLTLDRWYCAAEIFSLTEIAVIRRECARETAVAIEEAIRRYREQYGARIRYIPAPAVEISSSEIRDHIRAGRDTGGFLTPEVEEYIKKWQLYRD